MMGRNAQFVLATHANTGDDVLAGVGVEQVVEGAVGEVVPSDVVGCVTHR